MTSGLANQHPSIDGVDPYCNTPKKCNIPSPRHLQFYHPIGFGQGSKGCGCLSWSWGKSFSTSFAADTFGSTQLLVGSSPGMWNYQQYCLSPELQLHTLYIIRCQCQKVHFIYPSHVVFIYDVKYHLVIYRRDCTPRCILLLMVLCTYLTKFLWVGTWFLKSFSTTP